MKNLDIKLENILIDKTKKLGSGYISDVFLGIYAIKQKKYAVKIIDLKRVGKQEYEAL